MRKTTNRKTRPSPPSPTETRLLSRNAAVTPDTTASVIDGPRRELPNWVLPVLLGVSLLLSLLFAGRVPYDANPDEQGHFDYVRLLWSTHNFVKFVPNDPALVEVHQPPLYYLLCVPFYGLSGGNLFATRVVAALLQLGTITIIFRACRDLFPNRSEIAVGTAAFVTFLPIQAQLSGAVNNDSLTTLLCAALFWRMGHLLRAGIAPRKPLVLGLLLGAALLTKLSVLQLLPTLIIAFGLPLWAERSQFPPIPRFVRNAGLTLLLALLIASPWLIRNTILYGDPLTLQIYRQTGANKTPEEIMQISQIPQIGGNWTMADYVRNVAVRSFATFWYFLPPTLPPNARFIGSPFLVLLVLLLALGGGYGAYQAAKRMTGAERNLLSLYALGLLFIVPFFARFVLTVFQAQGRYFLPALLPAALLCVTGWSEILRARSAWFGALLPAGVLLLLTLFALSRGGYMP